MGTQIKLLMLIVFISFNSLAQEVQRKDVNALRIDQPLKIDGKLDEGVYARAEIATDFVQLMPNNGEPSMERTEVRIFYDDDAIYFGAMLYDNPDSIANYITTRDNIGVADYFLVAIDPNNEGMLAYEFLVTPANSQTDIKGMRTNSHDMEDGSWNAVWQSGTQILDNGWSVEFRIPYSAIRFAEKDDQVWGLNFFRRIRRYNSNNSWNLVNFEIDGYLHQTGRLHGLENIKPPVRLSISPYVAQYAELKPGADQTDFVFKGGLDLKYGLSESHTLDMMLIPDFGQIQSDDEELNLSPFELHYDEKRQFFNEGAELFGRAGLFYSRRIGKRPLFSDTADENLGDDEELDYNPSSTQMVNATKISGKGKNGLGIGFLNAMTLPAKARIKNTKTGDVREVVTQPFTNYNVTVLEKSLTNNSYVSLINTNLSMVNNPYMANTSATEFQLKNKQQTYQVSGAAGFSYKPENDDPVGHAYGISFSKIKGKFRFELEREVFAKKFDMNDMGYLRMNNIVSHEAEISYFQFEPKVALNNWSAEISLENTRLYEPNKFMENGVNVFADATFKNNMWLMFYAGYNPDSHDYFEPRSSNNSRYYVMPRFYVSRVNFRTDMNKPLSWFVGNGFYNTSDEGRYGTFFDTNLWWKATQRLNIIYALSLNTENQGQGFVDIIDDDNIFYANYDRRTVENVVELSYTFNTKMAFDIRARHYWSVADYEDDHYLLNEDGGLSLSDHQSDNDVNFNAFNIDATLRWEFAPGSELSLSWKNSIYDSTENVDQSFFENLTNTFEVEQNNNVSLKLLYYIDYNTLFKKKG